MLYEMNYDPSMIISLAKGNVKLGKGVYAFNLMPGDEPLSTKEKGQLTNVRGTCVGCCEECKGVCYAIRDASRYHNTCIPSLGKNTLIMRNDMDNMFHQLKDACIAKNVRVLRYHSSGEIENYDYLLHMVKLAVELPDVKFYFYTKRFGYIEKYLTECGELPENLICNISEWNGNTSGFNLKGMNVFTYDDGSNPSLESVVHCPAVDKNGHKTGIHCDQCKRCFSKNDGHVTAVYSH